jgi:hypothetical protein
MRGFGMHAQDVWLTRVHGGRSRRVQCTGQHAQQCSARRLRQHQHPSSSSHEGAVVPDAFKPTACAALAVVSICHMAATFTDDNI